MTYEGMTFQDLRPGMIFVDATKPTRRRVVVLKIYPRSMVAWVCTVGGYQGPYQIESTSPFYWSSITPHNKPRRSGYYLDTEIPGNTPTDWKKVPRYVR